MKIEKNHINKAKNGSNYFFHKALRKYGENNFIWEIINSDCKTEEDLNLKEIYYIKKYNSTNKFFGYNINSGGNGGDNITNNPNRDKIIEKIRKSSTGRKHSKESIQKIIKAQKGRKFTEEHKRKIKEARKQQIFTKETRRKISIANSGKNNYFFGKKRTEEEKLKISNAKIGITLEMRFGKDIADKKKQMISKKHSGKNNPRYYELKNDAQKFILENYGKGMSIYKISYTIGINRGKINRFLQENNINIIDGRRKKK